MKPPKGYECIKPEELGFVCKSFSKCKNTCIHKGVHQHRWDCDMGCSNGLGVSGATCKPVKRIAEKCGSLKANGKWRKAGGK